MNRPLEDMGARLVRDSLAGQVAQGLTKSIIDGEFPTGSTLPTLDELAAQVGVSRNVVREALAELSAQGVVTRGPRRGYVVSDPGSKPLEHFLTVSSGLVGERLFELLELREAVEVQAARLAAERRTPEALQSLRETYDAMAAAKTQAGFWRADRQFHDALIAMTGNTYLRTMHEAYAPLLEPEQRTALRSDWPDGVAQTLAMHKRILSAVVRGEELAAADAMLEHLRPYRLARRAASP